MKLSIKLNETQWQYIKYFILFMTIYIIHKIFSNFVRKTVVVKGVSENVVYFGQTINLKDKEAHSYSNGFVVAFNTINNAGGINGRYINLLVYDDEYKVKRAVQNAKLLIDYQNVLALIGTWGTPTTMGIINNVIGDKNIPHIAPLTGTNHLYRDFDKNLIITRDSYKNEINTILKHANKNRKTNMGIIYQNDDYGISCFADVTDCILDNKYNIEIVTSGSFQRNSRFYYPGLKKLFDAEPYDFNKFKNLDRFNEMDCVLLICTDIQKTKLIQYFKRIKPDIFIYTIALTGDISPKIINHTNMDNIYSTDVYPHIKSKYPIAYKNILAEIKEYNKTLKEIDNSVKFNNIFFSGWLVGKMICRVLQNIHPKNINRETFIDTFYKIKNFNIYDYKLGPYIDKKNNVGSKSIYLYKYNKNKIQYELIKKYKSDY
jgi:hypothetical protein